MDHLLHDSVPIWMFWICESVCIFPFPLENQFHFKIFFKRFPKSPLIRGQMIQAASFGVSVARLPLTPLECMFSLNRHREHVEG